MRDLRELSHEELTDMIVEMLSRMSNPKRIASLLTVENPEISELLLRDYGREDFMEALEILEQRRSESPDDEGYRVAIGFIRRNIDGAL